jgi:restriction endonuclease Mrr
MLIEGTQLAGIRVDHGVGDDTASVYEVKRIDSDDSNDSNDSDDSDDFDER